MKPILRFVVAGLVVLVVVVAVGLIGVVHWPRDAGDPYAPGPGHPTLLVIPGWTQGGLMAEIHGNLGVNAQGCVTIGGDVVMARDGSRITADGKHVVFPGWAPITLDRGLVGGGGYYGGRRWLEKTARGWWDDDLVDAVEHCLGDDPNASAVQFWLD